MQTAELPDVEELAKTTWRPVVPPTPLYLLLSCWRKGSESVHSHSLQSYHQHSRRRVKWF